jgi:hypothetical protein
MAIRTFDARDGFSSEVLQELRSATRVVLALKDRNTAALGYWVVIPRPDQHDAEEFRLVVLHAHAMLTHGNAVSEEQPLVIVAAQDDLLWQEALKHVHPGNVATVQWAVGWAAVSLMVAKHSPERTGAWGSRDFRKWTVTLAEQHLWPGIHLTPNFIPTYFLGHTTSKRRWRSGQPTWRIVRPPAGSST